MDPADTILIVLVRVDMALDVLFIQVSPLEYVPGWNDTHSSYRPIISSSCQATLKQTVAAKYLQEKCDILT